MKAPFHEQQENLLLQTRNMEDISHLKDSYKLTSVPDSLQAIFPAQEAKAMQFSMGCNFVYICKSNNQVYMGLYNAIPFS